MSTIVPIWRAHRWLILFLIALTLLRLCMAGQMELSPDEAYYYQWSQRLDWAYYSKGPGVAMAIRIGTALLGASELGVRLLSPFLALGSSLFMFALARRLYGDSVAVWTVLLMNLTPIFQAGSMVMTIDALSIFFWSGALLTFWLALEQSQGVDRGLEKRAFGKGLWYWAGTGLFMALGFLSKYTNAIQILSIVLVLAVTPRFRREFRQPGFWAMVGVFILGIIPPLVWNAHHDWITVEHLLSRGSLDTPFQFRPGEVLAFLGLHFGVYSPLLFAGMLIALIHGCREARSHFKPRFLVLFSLPLLALYFTLAIKKCGEANWTAPAFVSLGIFTVAYWHGLIASGVQPGWLGALRREAVRLPSPFSTGGKALLLALEPRRFALAALCVAAAMSLLLVNTEVIRRVGVRYPYSRDPGTRLRGWRTAAMAIDDLRHRLEKQTGRPMFLIANRYQSASAIAFYLPEKRADGPGHPPVYIPESQAFENQYSFWPRYDEMVEAPELARSMLQGVADAAMKNTLANALAAATDPKAPKEGADGEERRRALIRAMLAVAPGLPLDEYASQEMGVSLFHGRDALYISDHEDDVPPSAIVNAFESTEMVALWTETRRGLPLRAVRVFACHTYKSLPL